jgi:hypothetical protein
VHSRRRLGRVGRPLNLDVRTHMLRTATVQLLRRAVIGALFVPLVACADDCTPIVGAASRSPNGQWTAQATREVCGGKILALGSDSTVVVLARHKPNYNDLSAIVLSAESLNTDDLKIRWISNYQLELTVPARSYINVLVASYQGVYVAVQFIPSDPAERARWVQYQRATAEWVDQETVWARKRAADPSSAGPPPPRPQVPSLPVSKPQ